MNKFDVYIIMAITYQLLLLPVCYIVFAYHHSTLWLTITGATNIMCTAYIVNFFILKIVHTKVCFPEDINL